LPKPETNRAKIVKRLTEQGWQLVRPGKEHDIYAHGVRPGVISLPRHRTLSPCVARSTAKTAGWL
jgi:predicted RNA binding protein YcfA (HicA-like mRNA interferase family)